MDWLIFHKIQIIIQQSVSFVGVLIIVSGVAYCLFQFLYYFFTDQLVDDGAKINEIRLKLGRVLILGLEFIVAADLIGTTTTPDYYSVGILAIIVLIRTVLSFTLSRELMTLSKEQ